MIILSCAFLHILLLFQNVAFLICTIMYNGTVITQRLKNIIKRTNQKMRQMISFSSVTDLSLRSRSSVPPARGFQQQRASGFFLHEELHALKYNSTTNVVQNHSPAFVSHLQIRCTIYQKRLTPASVIFAKPYFFFNTCFVVCQNERLVTKPKKSQFVVPRDKMQNHRL